jgi:hypothetical protein
MRRGQGKPCPYMLRVHRSIPRPSDSFVCRLESLHHNQGFPGSFPFVAVLMRTMLVLLVM